MRSKTAATSSDAWASLTAKTADGSGSPTNQDRPDESVTAAGQAAAGRAGLAEQW
jgi:hypothetical protein